jgi:hypothetical protein
MEGSKRRKRKNDRIDANKLARLGRVDAQSSHPIQRRSREVRQDLVLLRARDAVMAARTELINATRGLVKRLGTRLSWCSSRFAEKVEEAVPVEIREALLPPVRMAAALRDFIPGNMRLPGWGRSIGASSLRGLQGRSATGQIGQAAKEKEKMLWRAGCSENTSGFRLREKCFSPDIPFDRTSELLMIRPQSEAALYSERSDHWVEAGLWPREIQQHHIRALLHSFEDNFTAVWGDVEVANVEVTSEVSQLSLGARLQVDEPEILMLNLSSQEHECQSSSQKGQVSSPRVRVRAGRGCAAASAVTAFTENVVPMSGPEKTAMRPSGAQAGSP